MPRGGPRPGAGRKKKAPAAEPAAPAQQAEGKKYQRRAPPPAVDADGFKSADAPPNWPFGKERPAEPAPPPPPAPAPDLSNLTPLDFLLEVMRDPEEDKGRRMQAATLAAPYCHPKKGEASAKKEAEDARKKAAQTGRFGRRQPPALTAVQGGKT